MYLSNSNTESFHFKVIDIVNNNIFEVSSTELITMLCFMWNRYELKSFGYIQVDFNNELSIIMSNIVIWKVLV